MDQIRNRCGVDSAVLLEVTSEEVLGLVKSRAAIPVAISGMPHPEDRHSVALPGHLTANAGGGLTSPRAMVSSQPGCAVVGP